MAHACANARISRTDTMINSVRRGSTCTSTEGRGGTAVAKAGAGRGAEPIENERDAMRWQRVATKRTNLVRTS